MQAAVLIFTGNALKDSIRQSTAKWAEHLRKVNGLELFNGDDPAFYGEHSLISTDQGIRGLLFIINDLCFIISQDLHLSEWRWENVRTEIRNQNIPATDEMAVTAAIKSFNKTDGAKFIKNITDGLSDYDWRTSSTTGLDNDERMRQAVFRGSSGYKELRMQLLKHLSNHKGKVGRATKNVMGFLGYK
jgi:hypothetical protein